MTYQYQFLKYTPTSKVDCPHCGYKKCFVRYVDTETGEILSTDFGKCDRENTCGYWHKPESDKPFTVTKQEIVEIPQIFIEKDIAESCFGNYNLNSFVVALVDKFGEEKAQIAINKYYIGTNKDNLTLFFYIDIEHRITSTKAMKYNGLNRDKTTNAFYPFKTSDGYYPCLFGLHLFDSMKDIHIVESEKTAIICSIVHDEIYMATGGANGLTLNKARQLKGHMGNIYLYPDADKAGREAVIKWKENLELYGLRCHIVDTGEYNNGEDLADLILG